jgi:NADH:ubiquinone oxidoreductase subunit 6 (subunit J)
MDQTAVVIAFWVLSLVTLGSALMVAMVRDLIHAVLFLILSFVGVAGLYVTLSADFVAVSQVLIYAGASSVLMIFAILLTPRSARDNATVSYRAPLSVLAGLVGAVIIFVSVETEWPKADREGFAETASQIGAALIEPHVLAFEVAGVLLVVAMLGAIMLVRPSEEGG